MENDEMSAAEFQLQSVVIPSEIGAAASWWGVDRKTLGQRWLKHGVEKRDPCPYQQPELMVEWYRRTYPKKPVHSAILKKIESLPVAESATEEKVEAPPQVPLHYRENEIAASLVERYREHEIALHRRYLKALEDPAIDERTRRIYREEWETAADSRRLQEQSAKKTGDMLPVAAFDGAFREFAARMTLALFNALPARLSKPEREAIARETLAQLPDHLEMTAA